ncbi:MAG TPA: metallophosphoesterase [Steroidobacteraceae bacterium]|jgi:hypothetical protein|nr:metallophosphoesterase [Steroidobacteraceae bacterium]
MSAHKFSRGRGAGNRPQQASQVKKPAALKSHAANSTLQVQSAELVLPHYPFQPLPTPNGPPPYRFDLSQLLQPDEVAKITAAGKLVFHSIGDTGDERGKQMDFVAAMMTQDYVNSPAGTAPAFFYHLGDVVYFAGDIGMYGECFYETYAEYPGLIVSIPGNHDCQPDDPQDGPVDPAKKPLDGWIQNFMSKDPTQLGSLKTTSSRTQMNLPNVYWTFTMPLATIIGLFTNVSESEAEVHPDQLAWFKDELTAADPNKALVVAIHHPPYSLDTEHPGSTVAESVLFESFAATGVYPHVILSGHVHNYQRFTVTETAKPGPLQIACIVAGNGGYSKLGTLRKVGNNYPPQPYSLTATLRLDKYDQSNFGFLRFEVTGGQIVGIYSSAQFQESTPPQAAVYDQFSIDLKTRVIQALPIAK